MLENYFKIILRNIRRQPAHTLLNLSCLTIGIAGTLLILLYLHFELTYDKFHVKAANIYKVNTNAIKTHEKTIDVTWVNTPATLGPTIEKEITGVENYSRIFQFSTSPDLKLWYNDNKLDVTDVYAADPSVFDIFSFDFVSGSPEESLKGPDKFVISESLANRLFGDADPLGKIVRSSLPKEKTGDSQVALVVAGVYRDMPKNTHLFIEALISSSTDRSLEDYYFNEFNVYTYLLLHPHTDVDQLAASLMDIYIKHVDPVRDPVLVSASHKLVGITDIHSEATGGYTYIYIFSAVGILLLVISAISYVNLATAQVSRRSLEIGLRKVMGSQRNQLVSQFLGESTVLTSIAAVVAMLIVALALGSLNEMLTLNLSFLNYRRHSLCWEW
jgi:putative ABC transport system permease protein